MKSLLTIILLIVDVLLIAFGIYGTGKVLQLYRQSVYSETEPILSYVVNPKKQKLQ